MRKYFSVLGVEIEFPEEILEELEGESKLSKVEDPFRFKKLFSVNTLLNFSDSEKDQFVLSDIFFILKEINFKAFDKFIFSIKHENIEKGLFLYKLNSNLYGMELYELKDPSLFSEDVFVFIKNLTKQVNQKRPE